MNNDKRVIIEGKEARDCIKKTIDKVGRIVSSTLGPAGRNAMLDRARRDRAPLITNDGVSIAEEIRFDNECEDLTAQSIIEVAKRTNEEAGDGTTTSITIAHQLTIDLLEKIPEDELNLPGRQNVMTMVRTIEEEKNKVIDRLKEIAEPIENLDRLKDVTFSSLENKEVGDIVAEAVWEVGKEGFTTMEVGYNGVVERETVKGMKVYAKYAAPFMVTNDKRQAVYINPPILVSNITFPNLGIIQGLLDDMNKVAPNKHNAIVIIGSKFESAAIQTAFNILRKTEGTSPFRILLVKAPSLTDEELEDVSAFLGATFINGDGKVGMTIEKAKYKDLGFADKMIVGDEETILIGGKGLKDVIINDKGEEGMTQQNRVEARIAKIKEDMKAETDDLFKKKIERRIGILAGGVSVIKVGAKTDTERSYLQLKVEDAINSARASLQEGIVKGGGLALKQIAEDNPDMLIANALKAPYLKIQSNAGETLDIPETVVDPVKVTRSAVENAVSVAKILITTQTIIAEKKESMVEKLKEMLPID